jgi:YD repeat-containing protein
VPEHRFPPPWTTEETDACFPVRDASGQALAYVYFEDQPGRRTAQRSTARSRAHTPLRRFILICGALCPNSPRSVLSRHARNNPLRLPELRRRV